MADSRIEASIERIPQEILDQILGYLDTVPPLFYLQLQKQPSQEIMNVDGSPLSNLKALSVTSKVIRQAVLIQLFQYAQIVFQGSSTQETVVEKQPHNWLENLSDLTSFLHKYRLGSAVRSLSLKMLGQECCSSIYEEPNIIKQHEEDLQVKLHWQRLLLEINTHLETVSIIAPPCCIGSLVSIRLSPYVSSAMHMPYHILSLNRSRLQAQEWQREQMQNSRPETSDELPSLLTLLNWTSLLLNEGSFLRYHADRDDGWENDMLGTFDEDGGSRLPLSLRQSIEFVEYIAIFPPDIHVHNWTSCLTSLPNIKTVTFRTQPIQDMAPDPHQRGFVHMFELSSSRQAIYSTIINNLIRIPKEQSDGKAVTVLQQLQMIHCTDSDTESIEAFKLACSELDDLGWIEQEGSNGSGSSIIRRA